MQKLDNAQWHAMTMFFSRRWFMRLWTFQEVLLAQTAAVCCGESFLDLEVLRCTALFLTRSGWHWQLHPQRESAVDKMDGYGHRGLGSILQTIQFCAGFTQYNPSKWVKQTLTIGDGFAKALELLLVSPTQREATDPRDYVYANLAMAMHNHAESIENNICPNYTKTPKTIYIETTKFITRYTQKLNIITYAQEPEFLDLRENTHNFQDLPSWVPSYHHIGGSAMAFR
jgi:hypothetical protein